MKEQNPSCNHDHKDHAHSHDGSPDGAPSKSKRRQDHSHGHNHGGHGHSHGGHSHASARDGNRSGLLIALIITAGIMVLQFFGGLLTNSLALLSDSGHMLSDTSALALSLLAIWFAAKPASLKRTFGFHRFEILAALFNGVTLIAIAIFIIAEAWERFLNPPEVSSNPMIVIAVIGLLANIASAWFLMRKGDVKGNVNMKSAYLHVIGDALGSVGAIVAGILMSVFGWYQADPIISVVVSLLIVKSAWGMMKSTIHILMEGTPPSVDPETVRSDLQALAGVVDVHDLHIWTITSGIDSMTCHLKVDDNADNQDILQKALLLMKNDYEIEHCTIQIETSKLNHAKLGI
ncbi:cation diffusion facilitator family transporter [Paenibacillus pasadenensis]|uniref:cation diffusion facilitator family transporter n=1 Tax=Paenibacillus pasadenensis TaxID=217090 RepID=UPI00203CF16C|nr:cation diffusion facilitator family transporter [Paenibacillus pasadenensis]MCM3749587.1 cation diffusion facilitator family transporter [Paenibacillus pasadenensis]